MPKDLGGIFRNVGAVQDVEEGGGTIGEIDLDFRTIKVGQKLYIKDIGAAYTVDKEDSGKMLFMTGAATVSLPTPDSTWEGFYVDIYNGADNTVTVSSVTTDTMIVDNDVAADSVAWSTGSHKIGSGARFFVHNVSGTLKWGVIDSTWTGGTITIAT